MYLLDISTKKRGFFTIFARKIKHIINVISK